MDDPLELSRPERLRHDRRRLERQLEARRQGKAPGQLLHLFDLALFDLGMRVVDRRHDQILQHLDIVWADDGHVHMTGPAVHVFDGVWPVS